MPGNRNTLGSEQNKRDLIHNLILSPETSIVEGSKSLRRSPHPSHISNAPSKKHGTAQPPRLS